MIWSFNCPKKEANEKVPTLLSTTATPENFFVLTYRKGKRTQRGGIGCPVSFTCFFSIVIVTHRDYQKAPNFLSKALEQKRLTTDHKREGFLGKQVRQKLEWIILCPWKAEEFQRGKAWTSGSWCFMLLLIPAFADVIGRLKDAQFGMTLPSCGC